MDAQKFLAEFGHIANAPGGVARLRELILYLAFKGEICTPTNESCSTLLNNIERQRIEFNGETRKQRLTRHSGEGENVVGPYEIPEHWRWVSLSKVGHTWGQKKPNATFVYIDVSSIDNRSGVLGQNLDLISPNAAPSRARKVVKKGTVVYSTVRPYLLNVAIIDCDFDFEPIASTAFAIVHPWEGISARYIYFFLRSPIFVKYVESVQIGMAYPAISDEKFYSGVIPLPPTDEQSRIVAKVDELMRLCDKLEAQQQARRKLQNNLRKSTLQAVANAASPFELQTTWARLADNFGRLFGAPEDVAELKSLILDLAIQGRLTDRSFEDEPAHSLIGSSLAAKRNCLASGEMKNKKPATTDIKNVEIEIPSHWARASLDELFRFIDYRGKTPAKTESGVVLVTAKNVRPGFVARAPIEYLSEISYQQWMTRGFPRIGDLLITTEAPLGNVARIEEKPSFALAQRVIDLQPFTDINTKCAMYFMMSPLFQSLLDANSTGMTAKGIKAGKLKQLPLPIPPKEEQSRIVQRVDELMKICEVLSSQIGAARKHSRRFAVASVSNLTGIAIEQSEEPMKAPQTELIAPLRLGTAPDLKAQAPLATLLARHNGEMSAEDLWQRFGSEIDAFYAQLKTEVAHGWILEPAVAEMREKQTEPVDA